MNNITNGGKDYKGIRALAEAIKRNRVLISLNLNSTDLDSECSALLADAMQYNSTLISLDIEGNPEMDLNHVRNI